MRWSAGGRSSNLEDRRGMSAGGGGGGFGRGMGIGGTLILVVLSLIFGRDFVSGGGGPSTVPGQTATESGEVGPPASSTPEEERAVDFTSAVLDSVQTAWQQLLPQQAGRPYEDARLVLYRDAVRTGCGTAPSSVGPFYCPLDQRVYIDLSFYDDMRRRFGVQGDFAQAYVLAHEIGHHVQHQLGTADRVRQLQGSRPDLKNALSVRMELQADCYAGVWANADRHLIETGDIDEALAAASAVGDDRLQAASRGSVSPDSFTHGTAAQRSAWFKRGLESGDMKACDTFTGS
jgi:hypothetical protein